MPRQRRANRTYLLLALLALLLAGCATSSATAHSSMNAYGGPENHVHDMLALRGVPRTVLLATHVGLYRSHDAGKSWVEVAGGTGQPMAGLMTYKLTQSPVDPLRLYVLGIVRSVQEPHATPGIYTSTDAGATWSLASALSMFPGSAVYTLGAGTASASQIFAILPAPASEPLYVSNDYGKDWQPLPAVPTTSPIGITGDDIASTRRMFLWSATDGLFFSDTDGLSWQRAAGIRGGADGISVAGPSVYVEGQNGLYVSSDGGLHFAQAPTTAAPFIGLAVAPSSPRRAYAYTGEATDAHVYITDDSGVSWRAAALLRAPASLAVDPANPNLVYAGFSLPLGVAVTSDGGAHWQQRLP